ncbi:unnamed protein product [Arabis nemorensis]|uniref:Uncharacterized protein n=1 Tax=Arabis nemorensis TaxID=586526 RepID=A0A565BDB5_9BRAS|nr:unnamed protein product [Arabis nemorensis]
MGRVRWRFSLELSVGPVRVSEVPGVCWFGDCECLYVIESIWSLSRDSFGSQCMQFLRFEGLRIASFSWTLCLGLMCFLFAYVVVIPQTLEMLEKKEGVLLKKAPKEVERAKKFTRDKIKRGTTNSCL